MNQPTFQIYNEDGSVRWSLKVEFNVLRGDYKVQEVGRSLFNSNNWSAGNTVGEAIDNFMKIETELINGL